MLATTHHGQPYLITIRLEPVEPIHGEEMFVARCEHFPELAMAHPAYDGLMAMIEKIWMAR